MRVAVITDIHANAHALDAVLAAIDAEPARPDAIWCLGDLVGYGPRPNECVRTVRSRAAVCLVGNHDLGVTGDKPITGDWSFAGTSLPGLVHGAAWNLRDSLSAGPADHTFRFGTAASRPFAIVAGGGGGGGGT